MSAAAAQSTSGTSGSAGDPMGVEEDDDDLLPPDLGLGTLSAEDIKWVDLEFLDLASGPPANSEKSRNKNPTLSDNFPDIFFGDATTSLFNANFNIDDFKPFGETFTKESGLDLESVEKNILVRNISFIHSFIHLFIHSFAFFFIGRPVSSFRLHRTNGRRRRPLAPATVRWAP